ncbi:DENN domain-containing protein 5B [Phytophthora nicotianae]|uniref:DENN domain-containing protein 5B n=1 Tax=Phytophthora nicotianae TaxID=4792 RepID=A0A0W8CRJ3_PHYNI|nr:DENN domain-containing protein 5B [Phytophthora nicotianae]
MMMFSRSNGTNHSPVVQQQAFRKLTEMMHSSSENQCCADCTSRLNDSIWASTTVGAFLCINCAGAHRKLGVQLSRVKSLHLDTWTDEEVAAMKGGNKTVNEIYNKYFDKWLKVDASLELLPNAATDIREKCIRAKYEVKQFTKLPVPIEEKNQDSPENPEETNSSTPPSRPTEANQQRSPARKMQSAEPTVMKAGNVVEVTKRFLNYFVVVGRGALIPDQNIEKTKSPTEIRFLPAVLDMFPDEYRDSPLPAHLADFAFPEGFVLNKSYVAPVFFSFVLTNKDDNQRTQLPQWVQDLSGDVSSAPGPVFCPKCVVVTSLYPYFSAVRQFLQQIYRVTLSESPMPIERYIANFLVEIPLPPPGQIQVQLTLPDRNLIISRPPKNELPLVDFPFRPLFQVLDMNNVLLVFSCVALELKVVLCSKHIGLLTPVGEALLAILLPFSWQGAYIPVLPTSLLDVIDAPVPFLVGTHSDCLKQIAGRSTNVVFVDLDHNRVIPAVDDSGKNILVPKLPDREGSKLRAKLAEVASIFDPYAAGISRVDLAFPNEEHLEPIGNFASDHGQTIPLSTSYSESSMSDSLNSHYSIGKIKRGRRSSAAFSLPTSSLPPASSTAFSRTGSGLNRHTFSASASMASATGNDASGGLTDSRYNETDNFSTEGIRKAFLRFFVTLFKKYANYLQPAVQGESGTSALFDSKRFLQDNFDAASRPFVAQLIATQMFDRFIEDRIFNPQLSEVLFFDQSINQKLNRSLTIGKKKYDCSFLEDRSDEIQETFIAPPPSNIGLPDDGTIYKYKAFPRLKKYAFDARRMLKRLTLTNLFGNFRKPRELYSSREQQRNVSRGKDDRQHFLALRNGAIMIQKIYRTRYAVQKYQKQRVALVKLQFMARGFIVYARYRRMYRGFCCLQALWRGSFFKRSYKNLKYQVIRAQCRIRGFLSRKRTTKWKIGMLDEVRRKVYDLWERCDTPLLYRSKFWLTFNRIDFFTIGVYHEEETRLNTYFSEGKMLPDVTDRCRYSDLNPQDTVKQNEVRGSTFAAMKLIMSPRTTGPHKNIKEVTAKRMKGERSKIYNGLKYHTQPPVQEEYYKKFGIELNSKRKKRRLAALVWTNYATADCSAEVVISTSMNSDQSNPLPTQIDHQKQLRLREDLAFTVNAALKSIRVSTSGSSDSSSSSPLHLPKDRALVDLQHQVRHLALQNRRLTDDLAVSTREASELRLELQNMKVQQLPQLQRTRSSNM